MDFLDKDISKYLLQHTEEEPSHLAQINRFTHLHVLRARMLSGHYQGRVLAMLSHMVQPEHILEIGTYTGYSALCLAEGMQQYGKLTTIDINEELKEPVQKFFDESPYAGRIDFVTGNALDIIPSLDGPFDLVFIDADKTNYKAYYELVIEKVRKGGFIIADNVLWSGKVLAKNRKKDDKDTLAILEFNKQVHEDKRVSNVLLPIRDGLMVLRKH